MGRRPAEEKLLAIYSTLARAWGRQHWWRAQSRFEVILGAYLAQNTSWHNFALVLARFGAHRVLTVAAMRRTRRRKFERLGHSLGYFHEKTERLKEFVEFLDRVYRGLLEKMFTRPTEELRQELLSLPGGGPKVAGSVLLYAASHPLFDAYTRRLASRRGILPESVACERALKQAPELASLSARSRPRSGALHPRMSLARREPVTQAFGEMHGLLVGAGRQPYLNSQAHRGRCPRGPLFEAGATAPGQNL